MEVRIASTLGLLFSITAAALSASEPRLSFDVGYTAPALLSTQDEPSLLEAEKAFEARFLISSRMLSGSEKDIKELTFSITAGDERLRVLAWSPETTYAADVEGRIDIVLRRHQQQSHDVGAEAGVPFFISGIPGSAAGKASIAAGEESTSEGRFSRLPAKEWIVTSGTTQRERGVFFKLRPHSQATLEGSHVFTVVFAAPSDWKASAFEVTCEAVSKQKQNGQSVVCGGRQAFVGVFLASDGKARSQAVALAEKAEHVLQEQERIAHARKRNPLQVNPLHVLARNVPEVAVVLRPILKQEAPCNCK